MNGWTRPRSLRTAGLLAATLVLLTGCHRVLDPELHPPGQVPVAPAELPVLKVHMQSGRLYVLESWRVVEDGRRIEGTGTLYAPARERVSEGAVSIDVAEVALFETNRPDKVAPLGTTLLGVMTTVTGAVAAYCASDPKACFGSCPTFYLRHADRPVAEGFSASFARVLEGRDVDALPGARGEGGRIAVIMRNEALETHAVRRVGLLVAPRPEGTRVLAGIDGRFYPALPLPGPRACRAAEGDCLAAIATEGGGERFSSADSNDLATRELVELEFGRVEGRVGLVVTARQTLLSTHVFYQSLAYFGTRAGAYLATLERGGPVSVARALGLAQTLGGIEAEVSEGDGPWRKIGTYDEAGPIARDVQVLPFEAKGSAPLRVRLRQARGHWRIDRVAVVRLGAAVDPVRLDPSGVERGGRNDPRARALLVDDQRHLITFPGDVYRLVFDLPGTGGDHELFLESEGYYYEWMREEWLTEEDTEMASLVLTRPAETLRRMAGPVKQHEAEMEHAFWTSRFRR
jgi:hypothetical protein